jgi:two-component system cell cycle response regulator
MATMWAASAEAKHSRMNVIVVDSSRVVLRIMAALLADCGHDTRGFQSAEAALDWIRCHDDVDVVITSLELPGMSGFELCWNVRLVDRHAMPIHILAMSSMSGHERLPEALDSGADDFIGKPPRIEELSARLRAAERIRNAQKELIHLATRDPLTDLLNRRAFFEAAASALSDVNGPPVGVLMADIDHFKRVNDTWGHEAGDEVIRAVGNLLKAPDLITGRLGGEEFAVMLRHAGPGEVLMRAEAVRKAVAAAPVQAKVGPIPVTISVGISLADPGQTVADALRPADEALYAAKAAGRNRTECAPAMGIIGLDEPYPPEPVRPLRIATLV